jgi:hypothetical protein
MSTTTPDPHVPTSGLTKMVTACCQTDLRSPNICLGCGRAVDLDTGLIPEVRNAPPSCRGRDYHCTLCPDLPAMTIDESWDHDHALHPEKINTRLMAQPYDARQCPKCKVWVFTAAGPFAEGDPTKTVADWLHWEAEHLDPAEADKPAIGFPFFSYNDEPVEAVHEGRAKVAT